MNYRNDIPEEAPVEINFIALPGSADVARMLEGSPLPESRKAELRRSYTRKLRRLGELQRSAAVEALAACRPHDWRESDREYRYEVAIARRKHEDRCLAVFTEKCTRGL